MHTVLTRSLRMLGENDEASCRLASNARSLESASNLTTEILEFAATVAGLAAENMVRGGGRLFLDFGRRMERAQAITAELAQVLDQPGAVTQPGRVEAGLRLALELRDSVITYRTRYLAVLQPAPALDLILADEGNPRGLAFQLVAARELLREIVEDGDSLLMRSSRCCRRRGRSSRRCCARLTRWPPPLGCRRACGRCDARSARWRTGCPGGISPCCRLREAWAWRARRCVARPERLAMSCANQERRRRCQAKP